MTTKWSEVKRTRRDRPRHLVFAERDGRFWFLRIPKRPELFTQVVRLDQAEAMVRDLVATYDDVPPDSFDVTIRPILDEETTEATEALWHLRLIDSFGVALTRSLAVHLVRDKALSMRDAGRIIGLSHQRVAQLVEEHDALGGDARKPLAFYVDQLDQLTRRSESLTVRFDDPPEQRAAALAELRERAASTAD